MYKSMNEAYKSMKIVLHYIKFTHLLSFRNLNLRMEHYTGGPWFIHCSKQVSNMPADNFSPIQLAHCFSN